MNIPLTRSTSLGGCAVAVVWLAFAPPAAAGTQILSEATIEADAVTVLEITSTFDQAEEAIRSHDLEALMSLYAQNYRYHGIGKDGIRKIWADLFARYDLITNLHTFSAITVTGTEPNRIVRITCTGALHGIAKNSKQPVPIDSWYREDHYLVKERGAWRILGNASGDAPAVLPFGAAPHPLF
jgi:ketosteroid isomerase-like protein